MDYGHTVDEWAEDTVDNYCDACEEWTDEDGHGNCKACGIKFNSVDPYITPAVAHAYSSIAPTGVVVGHGGNQLRVPTLRCGDNTQLSQIERLDS